MYIYTYKNFKFCRENGSLPSGAASWEQIVPNSRHKSNNQGMSSLEIRFFLSMPILKHKQMPIQFTKTFQYKIRPLGQRNSSSTIKRTTELSSLIWISQN